uniref:Uncharacterized protein n=1 Tax=Oryza glumipatula TaxID=40148 RepID=A0A0E0AHG8_9ORYZ
MAKARVNLTVVVGLSLVALLVLTAVEDVGVAADNEIGYTTMNHDDIPGTPKLLHPGGPANTYTRGCEKEQDCRD